MLHKITKLKYLLMVLFAIPLVGCTPDKEKEPEPVYSMVVQRAIEELGKPYIWGGVGPDGYDASGLVSYCITGTHLRIGTVYTFLEWPETSNPVPGDVCVSHTTCGIYVKDNTMIYAPTTGQAVTYNRIFDDMIFVKYQD